MQKTSCFSPVVEECKHKSMSEEFLMLTCILYSKEQWQLPCWLLVCIYLFLDISQIWRKTLWRFKVFSCEAVRLESIGRLPGLCILYIEYQRACNASCIFFYLAIPDKHPTCTENNYWLHIGMLPIQPVKSVRRPFKVISLYSNKQDRDS